VAEEGTDGAGIAPRAALNVPGNSSHEFQQSRVFEDRGIDQGVEIGRDIANLCDSALRAPGYDALRIFDEPLFDVLGVRVHGFVN
jgi:hypothetical protein